MIEIRNFGNKYAIYDSKRKVYLGKEDFFGWIDLACINKYCLYDTLEEAYAKYTEIGKVTTIFPEPWYRPIRIVKHKDKFLIKRFWWIFSEYLDKEGLDYWWSDECSRWASFDTLEEAVIAKDKYLGR